jgi:hypothetical protein
MTDNQSASSYTEGIIKILQANSTFRKLILSPQSRVPELEEYMDKISYHRRAKTLSDYF